MDTHMVEAAKLGYEPAVPYALDALFFRANSLSRSHPEMAYSIYMKAKTKNPALDYSYMQDKQIKALEEAIEIGPLDPQAFIEKYTLTKDEQGLLVDGSDAYAVWQIAEKASTEGRFGKPDPQRTLQLIAYGCFVPAECTHAISDFYDNWKQGLVKKFDICDYVGGTTGITFCEYR